MDNIEITQEILDNIQEFRGKMFKEFSGLNEDDESKIFELFVSRGLESAGIEVEDVYEQLSLKDFTKVLGQVMEINNMDELFHALDRLSRKLPNTK